MKKDYPVTIMVINGGCALPYRDIFYARGILGQYIIIIPSKKIIVVRLGKNVQQKE
ncbi:MAG: hypothetical protein WDO19_25925 [Bacteroidota bacterium]